MPRPLLWTALLLCAVTALLLGGLPARLERSGVASAPPVPAGAHVLAPSGALDPVPELRVAVPWRDDLAAASAEAGTPQPAERIEPAVDVAALRAELERMEGELRAARAALTPDQRGEWTGRLAGRPRPATVSPPVARLLELAEQRERLLDVLAQLEPVAVPSAEEDEPTAPPLELFGSAELP